MCGAPREQTGCSQPLQKPNAHRPKPQVVQRSGHGKTKKENEETERNGFTKRIRKPFAESGLTKHKTRDNRTRTPRCLPDIGCVQAVLSSSPRVVPITTSFSYIFEKKFPGMQISSYGERCCAYRSQMRKFRKDCRSLPCDVACPSPGTLPAGRPLGAWCTVGQSWASDRLGKECLRRSVEEGRIATDVQHPSHSSPRHC